MAVSTVEFEIYEIVERDKIERKYELNMIYCHTKESNFIEKLQTSEVANRRKSQ